MGCFDWLERLHTTRSERDAVRVSINDLGTQPFSFRSPTVEKTPGYIYIYIYCTYTFVPVSRMRATGRGGL